MLDSLQQFPLFLVELTDCSSLVGSQSLAFALQRLSVALLLLQQFGHLLVFSEQLRILLQNDLHFIFKFGHFLALELQNGIFFLQHGEIRLEQLSHAVAVLLCFDLVRVGTSFRPI